MSKIKNKKSHKPNVKSIVSGAMSSLILFQSCASPAYFLDEDDIVDINKKILSGSNRDIVIPIKINMNNNTRTYLKVLDMLLEDIIKEPNIAKRFMENPEKFVMKRYGITDVKINLDEYMLKTVLALSDTEVCNAIKNNDVSKFVELSLKHNLISRPTDADMTIVKQLFESNPELLDMSNLENLNYDAAIVAFAFAVAVGAAVFVWALAITHATVLNALGLAVGALGTVKYVTWADGEPDDTNNNPDPDNKRFIQSSHIWTLKGGKTDNLYVMGEKYQEVFIDDIMRALQKEMPFEFNKQNIEQIKQLIKVNLINIK